MHTTVAYILMALSVLLMLISLVIRKDFKTIGGICGVVAVVLFIIAVCILAFTGTAPRIVDDQYMPISYP